MPTKLNSAGQQQNYVPAGNGNASGEYGDNATGSNKHFTAFAKPIPNNFTSKVTNPKKVKTVKQTPKATITTTKTIGQFDLSKVANGKDNALQTYKRDPKYQYGIQDAMAKQGFDGLPQVVDQATFDEMVKQSNFIAMRGIGASSKKVLDSYTQQLYSGEWYVDCSTGGAQYGQGMYCVGNYKGTVNQIMTDETSSYASNYGKKNARIEKFTLTPDAKVVKHQDIIKELSNRLKSDPSIIKVISENLIDPNNTDIKDNFMWDYYADKAVNNAQENDDLKAYFLHQFEYAFTGDVKANKKLTKAEQAEIKKNYPLKYDRIKEGIEYMKKSFDSALNPNGSSNYQNDQTISNACVNLGMNDGQLAVLLGFDAIKAEGHGSSNSGQRDANTCYTVILNRTKCAFLKQ